MSSLRWEHLSTGHQKCQTLRKQHKATTNEWTYGPWGWPLGACLFLFAPAGETVYVLWSVFFWVFFLVLFWGFTIGNRGG